ncbi:hypothetical protein ACOI1C_20620 [Bacillus sp. DJP31]|uniref:hypothetical protein n=1 Tax=Bacillus sp. DJP31 TaxID=3409789 RepID=UPI003BB71B85
MNKDQQELKKFLEQELVSSREQSRILEEISETLHKMKTIAEFASQPDLSESERENLHDELVDLKSVIHSLEKKLQSVFH